MRNSFAHARMWSHSDCMFGSRLAINKQPIDKVIHTYKLRRPPPTARESALEERNRDKDNSNNYRSG